MARMTRVMAKAIKRAMATNGNTTENGYPCPLSSAAAAAAVGKDDKSGGGLFFMVWWRKKWFVRFLNLMFGKEAVCPDGLFVPAVFQESRVSISTVLGNVCRQNFKAQKTDFWAYESTQSPIFDLDHGSPIFERGQEIPPGWTSRNRVMLKHLKRGIGGWGY
jgi:hypothetical protein